MLPLLILTPVQKEVMVMQREEFFKKELVAELRRVERYVREESDIEKKIYFFSAAYGITGRSMRYAFSKDILLADFVLQTTYNLLLDRLNRIRSGEGTVEITEKHFDILCNSLKELARRIEDGKSIEEPLKDILTVGFSVTGPGNYLRIKGELKL